MLATCMKPELPLTSIPTDLMCFIPLPRNSQEEVIFERQLVRFSSDLQIPITRESSAEDIEFISSYLTFIKFARIFLPEPGSCLSSLMYKSGAHTSLTFHVLSLRISLDSVNIPELQTKLRKYSEETKLKSIEMVLDTFQLMEMRKLG